MDKKSTEEKNRSFFTDFYNSRTPLWKSLVFLCLEAIVPGIILWLLVGVDIKNVSMADKLPSPHAGYAALICFCYVLLTIGLTTLCFFLKAHRADNFTYAVTIALIIAVITMLSFALGNNITFIFVKFLIAFALIIVGGMAGVFLTSIFTNLTYKTDEDLEKIKEKQTNGEDLHPKELKKLKKAEKAEIKANIEKEKAALIQKKLDEKLTKVLSAEENQKKDKTKF